MGNIFSSLATKTTKRIVDLDQAAPVIQPAISQLEEDLRLKRGVRDRHESKLSGLKELLEKEKLTCSSVRFAQLMAEVQFEEMLLASATEAANQAEAAFAEQQFRESKENAEVVKLQKRESLLAALHEVDQELATLNAVQRSIPNQIGFQMGKKNQLLMELAAL
jgi:hypothetical protein